MRNCKSGAVAIVEDDEMLRFLLRETVRASGCSVVGLAGTVSQAQKVLAESAPDILITDFALTGAEDGLQLIETAKRHNPGITTILVTGWDVEVLRDRIERVRPTHVLRKPVLPHQLASLLAAHAGTREAMAEAA